MAESWACKIVSKLNVVPFHNVNSPVEVPVNSLLPSGVHYEYKLVILLKSL